MLKRDNEGMSNTKQAIFGFSWHTAFKVGAALIALLKISILARLLTPAEFGLFSLATIALGLTEAATETGVNLTIMQSKHSILYFLDSAWVISIFRGVVIGIMMMVVGFFLTWYFDEGRLLFLVGLLSLVPVIKGFINPMIVSLYKEMRFFRDSLYRLTLVLVDAVAAISLGILLHSAYALVGAMILAAIFEVTITFLFFSDRPRFAYLHSRGKHILANGRWLSLSAFFHYLSENMDNFLVGKLAGTYNLGLYDRAYTLSHKPNSEIAKAVQHGTFPIIAQMVREDKSLLNAARKSSFALFVIALIGSLPLLLFPQLIVQLIFGEQWTGVAPMLPWLVGAGLIQAITIYTNTLFLATKSYQIMNLHLGISLLAMIGCVYVLGSNFGVTGAVMGLFVSRLLALPIAAYGAYTLLRRR